MYVKNWEHRSSWHQMCVKHTQKQTKSCNAVKEIDTFHQYRVIFTIIHPLKLLFISVICKFIKFVPTNLSKGNNTTFNILQGLKNNIFATLPM